MRVAGMNWMQVEAWLRSDDRCVLPIGSTEQHAYLSLATDNILAERVAVDAAEPLGVPVFPVVAYGITPAFRAYPGTVTLRVSTFLDTLRDILDSLFEQGFRRVLIVNGHGGNTPAMGLVNEWTADHPGARVKFHNWWNAPRVLERVKQIDPVASHASWMENFPWTRLAGIAMPDAQKPMIDWPAISLGGPASVRAALGDGNFGGRYARSDEDMASIWSVAIDETRALLTGGWE
jgi:creatinine amidohydrolase